MKLVLHLFELMELSWNKLYRDVNSDVRAVDKSERTIHYL